ncbi:hypothetical protein Dimus_031998 [Dionaea muscipula]
MAMVAESRLGDGSGGVVQLYGRKKMEGGKMEEDGGSEGLALRGSSYVGRAFAKPYGRKKMEGRKMEEDGGSEGSALASVVVRVILATVDPPPSALPAHRSHRYPRRCRAQPPLSLLSLDQ